MFKWAQETNVISISRVARSPGKKMKVSPCFSIYVILSFILETTNSSPIGGPSKHPSGFRAFEMMLSI